MTCRELADFIADYLAGEIPDETRRQFEDHLTRCPNCVNYLASYKTTVELGRRAFDDEDAAVPPEVPEDLVRAIIDARKQS
jgi:anti-sigma factor RsiW